MFVYLVNNYSAATARGRAGESTLKSGASQAVAVDPDREIQSRGMSASPLKRTSRASLDMSVKCCQKSTSQTRLWLRRANVWLRVTSPTWRKATKKRSANDRQGDGNVVTTFALL